jgi:metal-responsive CopG/Arc/MetJ family transcriptional regulator
MSTKKVLPKKKRGRPATGKDPVSAIRLSLPLRAAIDNWANQQPDKPSRSEAIRQLVEFALKAKSKRLSSRGDK